jgi:enoyl-CoA hydratase/carnithine racemase
MRIRSAPQPVLAAIEGPAVGAGLGLAAACDIRIAGPSARFIAPFLKMGLPPDYGSSYLVPRLVGADAALEMFLTCRPVGADEALRMGLVTRVSERPLDDALEMARVIAGNPTHAVGQTKRNVYRGLDYDMQTAIFDGEIPSVAVALHSDEFRESFSVWKAEIRGA